jgi:hypothetical protein
MRWPRRAFRRGTPQRGRVAAWLWLGIAGNAVVLVIYFSSRSIGLPIGPDTKTVEAWGGLDLVCSIEEILLVVIAAMILARPGLLGRPVRLRGEQARVIKIAAGGAGSPGHPAVAAGPEEPGRCRSLTVKPSLA